MKTEIQTEEMYTVEGLLEEVVSRQTGRTSYFIRNWPDYSTKGGVYVHINKVREYNLKNGDYIVGMCILNQQQDGYVLEKVEAINGNNKSKERVDFKGLIPSFPDEMLRLETKPDVLATRIIDLIVPIGKGQRGMIVAQPKSGKTTILKQIAKAIRQNNPEVHLMVLLIGERPEEVTDFKESVNAEVISATFDKNPEFQCKIAELTIERGKRLVEQGEDVVILMDSITRLVRAYNTVMPAGGKILTGGVDARALVNAKKIFGAARNIENGGSITILATALVKTGSRMDDSIFEEFKGTGNWELVLDRELAERRIFPAIDINASSTRNDDRLLTKSEIMRETCIRREYGIPRLLNLLKNTQRNSQLYQL